MEIKAIETKYDGYRFRSRLEARWAVFFNELNIDYEYEPEGYKLNDGTLYLPDFYLPKFKIYAEVKPWIYDKISDYINRGIEFVNSTGTPIMYLFEFTHPFQLLIAYSRENMDAKIVPTKMCATFTSSNDLPMIVAQPLTDSFDVFINESGEEQWNVCGFASIAKHPTKSFGLSFLDGISRYRGDSVDQAIDCAKGARFEHGECG